MAKINYIDPVLEGALKEVPEVITRETELAIDIVKRIYDILSRKSLTQADLARATHKTEAEVSRWLSGTYNFTIKSLALIESATGEKIISVNQYRKPSELVSGYRISPRKAAFLNSPKAKYGKK
jgi:transcriptional regulator with XRE-family HTH domain